MKCFSSESPRAKKLTFYNKISIAGEMEDKDTNDIKECEYFARRRKRKELILKIYFIFIHSL